MQRPPSTSSATPVMKAASSETSQSAALAMSSGCDRRPSGINEREAGRLELGRLERLGDGGGEARLTKLRAGDVHPDLKPGKAGYRARQSAA